MIATYVPPVLTPIPRDLAVKCFLWALPKGTPLKAVALALAQSALETGRWQKCWNWDYSNAKAGPKYEGMYTSRRCNELLNGELCWFRPEGECDSHWNLIHNDDETPWAVPPGHPQTRFRAYANAYDGCLEHVGLMQHRFGAAYALMLLGDPGKFVMQLREQGYFTAPVEPYAWGVASLQREFLRVLEHEQDVPEEPIDDELAKLISRADALMVEQTREDW